MLLHWLKDPFVLLLLLGGVLYLSLDALRPQSVGDNEIIVDQAHLLFFIQERSKAFEPQAAQALLDEMPPGDVQQLIRQYVEEEALFRKARALGLEESDYVMRLRMVQKYEFLLESALEDVSIDSGKLQSYFETNRAAYREPALMSFTHLFFADGQDRNARQAARNALDDINAGNPATDLFPYQKQYNIRPETLVRTHFGADFARTLFTADYPRNTWVGPLQSEHGWHLVKITQRRAATDPDLESIRFQVQKDYRRAEKKQQMDGLIDDLVAGYEIRMSDDIKARTGTAP